MKISTVESLARFIQGPLIQNLRDDAKNFKIILERDLEYRIYHHITNAINKKILIVKIFVVSILIVVGLFSLPILTSSGYVHFKHALEWNYFLGVITFYLFTFLFWKKT